MTAPFILYRSRHNATGEKTKILYICRNTGRARRLLRVNPEDVFFSGTSEECEREAAYIYTPRGYFFAGFQLIQ